VEKTGSDPLASFFDDRPPVNSFEDPGEALSTRINRNNARQRPSPRKARRSRSASRHQAKRGRSGSRSQGRKRQRRDDRSDEGGGGTLDEFIEDNELDDKVAAALRNMRTSCAKAVMAQGFDVKMCRNPSAVVMSRIRKSDDPEEGKGFGKGGGDRGPPPRRRSLTPPRRRERERERRPERRPERRSRRDERERRRREPSSSPSYSEESESRSPSRTKKRRKRRR